jgi:hypothetical protein
MLFAFIGFDAGQTFRSRCGVWLLFSESALLPGLTVVLPDFVVQAFAMSGALPPAFDYYALG